MAVKETIVTAKTVELAVEKGAAELAVAVGAVKFDIIDEPKKGLFGIGATDAKVKVYYEIKPVDYAVDFLTKLLNNMKLEADIKVVEENESDAKVSINGENLGLLIGHHGDVLDSIQYLTGLAANKDREEFYRVNVDIEGYRAKREDTLKTLARRMADKVLKYRKSFTLEPMSASERRIIHSEIQDIEGVTTYSIGEGADRKIVIVIDKKSKTT